MDKSNIRAIIQQREEAKNKEFLECPVCSKMAAEIDKYRPNLLRCFYCLKSYELNKIDLDANKD